MKPRHEAGYQSGHAQQCERALVTILRSIGPWKQGLYLIGGLVPRYLVGPTHVGTSDVDLLCDLELFEQIEAYRTLERNLESSGFERNSNEDGKRQNFSWVRKLESGFMVLDLLCPIMEPESKRIRPLEGNRQLSAIQLEGGHLVLKDFMEIRVEAELLDGGGESSAVIRVANFSPFLVLKALAYEERKEEKDAYDIVFCLTRAAKDAEVLGREFGERYRAWDEPCMQKAVGILRERFATSRKDGCVSYARFRSDISDQGLNALRSQEAAAAVAAFLRGFDSSG